MLNYFIKKSDIYVDIKRGVAAAVYEYPAGGIWYYNWIAHTWCASEYFHSTEYHSATSICGSGYEKEYKYGGEWARTEASGWGTTQVFWWRANL